MAAARGAARSSRRIFDIFVAEVPWTVSSSECLKEYFSQFGSVQRCQLPFDKDTGFHKRYCWIKFSSPEEVQNVLQKDSHILEEFPPDIQPKSPLPQLKTTSPHPAVNSLKG
uniref:SRA stem-loop interacting RNA binding protein n=1 Tax=Phasianus colchicus TaxID=9054 RepID=A0A669PIE5_PHACC